MTDSETVIETLTSNWHELVQLPNMRTRCVLVPTHLRLSGTFLVSNIEPSTSPEMLLFQNALLKFLCKRESLWQTIRPR